MQTNIVSIQDVEVDVESELYFAGRKEDGGEFHAEQYFLSLTFKDGTIYRHYSIFKGCEVDVSDEGFNVFIDIRERAKAHAEYLLARVRAKGSIDLTYWQYHRTVYGSQAYQSYGAFEQLMIEKMEG